MGADLGNKLRKATRFLTDVVSRFPSASSYSFDSREPSYQPLQTRVPEESPTCDGSSSSLDDRSLRPGDGAHIQVPQGFLPVLIGPDYRTCYVICTSLLYHPLLGELLNLSAEEFGYGDRGALKLPCDSSHFEEVLQRISNGERSSIALAQPFVHSIHYI
ncbi:hypothetical protein KP509_02G052400 [Ceratopteris richardii]|uniref:Uncharacterized protein n=1 Tax=Ceratopteris richardii TaxID=49495 RepID=A0A8T2V9S0_CERRI|nr:hypothetical protein KP509_02G052400 [Ceratopteris richardii]